MNLNDPIIFHLSINLVLYLYISFDFKMTSRNIDFMIRISMGKDGSCSLPKFDDEILSIRIIINDNAEEVRLEILFYQKNDLYNIYSDL